MRLIVGAHLTQSGTTVLSKKRDAISDIYTGLAQSSPPTSHGSSQSISLRLARTPFSLSPLLILRLDSHL